MRGERAGDAHETNFGEFLRYQVSERIIGTEEEGPVHRISLAELIGRKNQSREVSRKFSVLTSVFLYNS